MYLLGLTMSLLGFLLGSIFFGVLRHDVSLDVFTGVDGDGEGASTVGVSTDFSWDGVSVEF